MRLVQWAIRNPYAVAVMGVVIVIAGVIAATRIPADLLPIFKSPAVQILTFYPGMPAEVMEKDITTRLERWTGQSNGVARQESKSMTGVSIVKDFFRPDVDPNTAMSQVTSLAMSDLFYLPPGTIPPMVMPFDPTATQPLAIISASSPVFDETKLYDVAYFDLRNRLQGIPGVIAPAVYGGKLRRILAYVDPVKLAARNLSPLEVIDAIRKQNLMIPTGDAKIGTTDYQILTNGMVPAVSDINNIPIRMWQGTPVYVRDVAETKDANQIQTNVVRIDGKRQVYVPIYRQPGANTIAVIEGVKRAIGTILTRLPKGINLDVVLDQSVFVRKSIEELSREALLGSLLAAAVIFFFLGNVRATAIVLISLPLNILAALAALYFTNQTLNTMTLGGLALVVGLLIDQSIIILENNETRLEQGDDPMRAAESGAGALATPLFVVTIITIVVFIPVIFLQGVGKFLFAPLALAVAYAMLFSYITSLTVVPALASRLLKPRGERGRGFVARTLIRSELFIERVRDHFIDLLRRAVHHRGLVLLATAVLLAISLAAIPRLGRELFPEVDSGQIIVYARTQTGTRVEVTEEEDAAIEHEIRRAIPKSDLQMLITNIGVLNDWPAAYTPNSGPQDTFFSLQLTPQRRESAQEYARRLREALGKRFPETEFSFDTGGLMTAALTFGLRAPIDVQVEGNDLGVATSVAAKIRDSIARVPGAVDVHIQQRNEYPQLAIDVDRVKAATVGLQQEDVVKNIVTALNSSINFAPSFWIDPRNGNHYFIGAQYPESKINSFETIENIPITGARSAAPVLLKNIAKLRRASGPAEINHLNITRVTDVFADVHGRDIGGVAQDIERKLAQIEVPEGYFVRMRGEIDTMRDSFGGLIGGAVLAAVLVYLVLVVFFESFLEPLVIMTAAPLGLIGVVAALLFTRVHLSIPAMMGIVMMIGIVVAQSVTLLTFAKRFHRDESMDVTEASIAAARARFRPIAMTTIAACLGLVPMALTGGMNIPLARAVIGGVLSSAALTLFVVPLLFIALYARRATTVTEVP